MTGSSITINFLSRWGKKTIWKQKNVQNFADVLCCVTACSLKRKLEAFADGFGSHFIGRGFTSRSKIWIKLRSNTVHYHFCFLKSRKLLEIRDLYSKPTWQRTDFVNTRLYLPSKASLISVSELSGPKNYSFDSFLVQAGHLVFLHGNQRKNNKTSVSPCSKKSNTNGQMWNVKLFADPDGDRDD